MNRSATMLIAAAASAAALLLAGCGGGGSYRAAVGATAVIDPADLAVTVHVTNTGSSAGTPQCTIDASDPAGSYHGVDVATLKDQVAAGATDTFVDNLIITNQGASYVTSVKVTCQ